ncbi:unnamed protein product [Parnassius apollo]|uniref:(apollo) hypothetical protein n=1 Tax=Parnassius apollo TaxID=110799 RepID=A0A8S3WRS1_PARAO|nr:unnamed protein product [Parnassius apollo]
MVEISKHLFDEKCREVSCHILYHPWNQSCITSSLFTYKESFLGSAKFYLIVHLLQNLMRGKTILKRKELIQIGEYYVRSTLFGALVSGTCATFGCLFRFLMGNKMNYYTYILVPNTLNGLFILLEPPSRRGLVINLFCSLVLEHWLRSLESSGYLSLTVAKQTFIFMVGSAVLFYLMRREGEKEKRTPLFWLFTPEKVRNNANSSNNVCPHDGRCWKYILKGTYTYFGVGLAISLARAILPKIGSPVKAISSLRGAHFKLALFFGSYIGVYRTVICYLCRKRGYDSAFYALPAGCLAGLSLLFKPNLGFATASLTGAFKLFATILYEKKIIPENLPLPILLYCFCQGILFQARFLHPHTCPSYMFRVISTVSNGNSERLYSNLLQVVKGTV